MGKIESHPGLCYSKFFFVLSTKSTGCQVTQVAAPTYVFSWTVTRSPLLYRGASRSKLNWLDLRKIASTYRLQTTERGVEAKVSP